MTSWNGWTISVQDPPELMRRVIKMLRFRAKLLRENKVKNNELAAAELDNFATFLEGIKLDTVNRKVFD